MKKKHYGYHRGVPFDIGVYSFMGDYSCEVYGLYKEGLKTEKAAVKHAKMVIDKIKDAKEEVK